MDLVEVHVIRPKALQTLSILAQNRLARQLGAIRSVVHFDMHLGGDDDLIPIRRVFQTVSEDLLTRSIGVDVGGIEKIDPQLEAFLMIGWLLSSLRTHL
jgi:hypothetical protein